MPEAIQYQCDVLIVGSGAAGLSLALKLGENMNIAVLSKSKFSEGSTKYAQGGVAAVFDENDSIDSHIQDTMIAGGGLCDEKTVRFTAENARECMEWLIAAGVPFDQEEDEEGNIRFHLTREGGHSHRRILHAADATGKAIQKTLGQQVKEHPNIKVMARFNAVDLIKSKNNPNRVLGAYVWNRNKEKVEVIKSEYVVLATGGASKVYQYTSNPDIASGDGIAMAWRAGCRVANMEFNQFHPTCLFHPEAKNFLITEALRGEGAWLCHEDGTRFMQKFDERLELAPRDIVARAIDYEMKRKGADCMFLDISHKPTDFIIKHFPTIYKKCQSLGIDITQQPIPVVPAAHYSCGGVITDLNAKTDLDNVYAIGEVAYTGLHGANRMASNSLLECVVFAWTAAKSINQSSKTKNTPTNYEAIPPWDDSQVSDSDEQVVIQHNWHELRLFMWDYMGIVRTDKRLERALRRIQLLQQEIQEYYAHFNVSNNLLELRNLVMVAELMVNCALQRKESRGLHYNLDWPDSNADPKVTILNPGELTVN